ncbi:MAG: right-handed parallel beta-helix repeat-containing protein [Candidatus Hydrogenedens sp.]|nr:right-handed parallel beta-helix repeat-containing protein [Candidatus Hydrogenedens sp.]
MNQRLLISLLCLLFIPFLAKSQSVASENEICLFVSPQGNDAWSGSIPEVNESKTDGPLGSIQAVLDKVKRIRNSENGDKVIHVFLRGGSYLLNEPIQITPEHSGKEKAPTIFESYQGEKPIISGGKKISGWKKEEKWWVADVPEFKNSKSSLGSVWVNRQRRQPARTPNATNPFGDYPSKKDFFTAKKYEYIPEGENQPGTLKVFYGENDDIQPWNSIGNSYCVIFCKWAVPLLPIRSIDTNERRLDLNVPPNFWFGVTFSENQKFYIEHLFEGLDTQGEWYLNRQEGRLYYIPYPDEDMNTAEVIVPVLEQLLLFEGNPGDQKFVKDMIFKGIEFAYTNFSVGDRGHSDPQAEVSISGAIQGVGARNCIFEKCTVQHVSNYAFWWREGSQDNVIRQCHLYDMGAGGIKIGETANAETDETTGPETADKKQLYLYEKLGEKGCGNNLVDNCFIHEGGRLLRAGIGVWIGRSSYNKVTHNEICDFRYSGMSIGWCWGYAPSSAHHNSIEYNHIHNIGKAQLADMGGIYTLGISPETVLRNNHIHDIMCDPDQYGGWGLYTDEGSSFIVLENNVVHHTLTGNFHQHYGRENQVINNIFALSAREQIIRSREEEHISFIFERNIVYYDNNQLLGSNWTNNKWQMDKNCYWNTIGEVTFKGKSLQQWQELGFDKNSIIADPLFVDSQKGDFRLKADSPALKLGFKPIDMSQIGLYGEDEWVNLPKKYDRIPCPLSSK